MLEIHHPLKREDYTPPEKGDIEELLEDVDTVKIWRESTSEELVTKVLLNSECTEGALDTLQDKYSPLEGFRIIISSVEATLPLEEEEEEEEEEKEKKEEKKTQTDRKSVQEIHQNMHDDAELSKTYVVLIVLAAIVGAIGVLRNDVAVIIGSMVIAPLISPIMALSLATTLADSDLAKNALITSIAGFALAIFVGILFGMGLNVSVNNPQIAARTEVSLLYILLALSAGVAGSLSITKDVSRALVGVMVAVALLPPLVIIGLLIGSYNWIEAFGATLLFLVYLVGLNLAGILTFVAQGIDPRSWWEKKKAKSFVKRAVVVWGLLLIFLSLVIYFYPQIIG